MKSKIEGARGNKKAGDPGLDSRVEIKYPSRVCESLQDPNDEEFQFSTARSRARWICLRYATAVYLIRSPTRLPKRLKRRRRRRRKKKEMNVGQG